MLNTDLHVCPPLSEQFCQTLENCPGTQICKDDGSGWSNCVDYPYDDCPILVAYVCNDGSTQFCTTPEGCSGIQNCKSDRSGWSNCVDIPDDNCPALVMQVCNAGSTQPCTTSQNCPGMQTCKSDGSGWWNCEDVPNDNCPPTQTQICTPFSTRNCQTQHSCLGTQTCKEDGNIWLDCIDNPNDNCPMQEIRVCEPDSTRFCYILEGCPGMQRCKLDGTGWLDCVDYANDNCPLSETQICNPDEINTQPCTNQDGYNGLLQVECKSDGSGWEPISNCYVPTQEERGIILKQKNQSMFEETFTTEKIVEAVEEKVFVIELNEEEEHLLQEFIIAAHEQREEALKMEEEFNKSEQESIKKGVKLKLLEKIKDISSDEFEKKGHLIKKKGREFIEKAQKEPELIIDVILKEDKEYILRDLNKNVLIKENTDEILESLKEQTVTIERINEELMSIDEKIEGVDIEKNLEETKKGYEEAIKNIKIEKVANVFEDEDIITGQIENITIISLFVKPEKVLHNLSLYESIPKDMALSSDEIIFYDDNFEILESDPLIMWNFAVVDSDIEVSYSIKKKFNSEILKGTKTMPIAKGIAEKELDDVESTKDSSLLKLLFPAFITASIVLIIIFFHKPSVKK